MRVTLRHVVGVLVLAGLGALVGGAASSSSAAACPAIAAKFSVALPSSPFAAEVNKPFTVTVTALSACDEPVSSYKGPASLTSNFDGLTISALKFKPGTGTATATVTATKSTGNGGAKTLTATDDANSAITGTSAPFEVYDKIVPCGNSGCSGSHANGTTTVNVSIPGNPTGFLGLSLGGSDESVTCTLLDGVTTVERDALGSTYTIAPPAVDGSITVTVTYTKAEAPATGVANFIHCKNSGPGTDFHQLATCANKNPQPPCIVDQRRTGVGELVVTMLITAQDPVGAGFG